MTVAGDHGRPGETQSYIIDAQDLRSIVGAIPSDYQVIGPVKEKLAVNLKPIETASDLAFGVRIEEARATYKMHEDGGPNDLSAARPMNSPKSFNLVSREVLCVTHRPSDTANGSKTPVSYAGPADNAKKKAFFGLNACDVSGMRILDKTFEQRYRDPAYEREREDTLIIGNNCFAPGNNCFCSTFELGPGLTRGYDIGLSLFDETYLVEVATEAGADIMSRVVTRPAPTEMIAEKESRLRHASQNMKKAFDLKRAVKVLNDNYDHPYWQEPSERCLSCANCINVCPTCYCYRVEEKTSANLETSTRSRVWDACQNLEFAAVHGGNFRPERVDRIRQWVNHKLNWTIEQYGSAGCVGCGRCVTWCPTAIDITEPVWRLGGKDIGLSA